MPRKKIQKSNHSSESFMSEILEIQSCLEDCELKLIKVYEKTLVQLEKQSGSLKKKIVSAKKKAALAKDKHQQAVVKYKTKANIVNKNREIKMRETLVIAKEKLAEFMANAKRLKEQYREVKILYKKVLAKQKALRQFEKTWNAGLKQVKLKKQPKKQKVKSSSVVKDTALEPALVE